MLWKVKGLQFILDIINYFSVIVRPLFMACICSDCYVAVVHPIVYKTSKNLIVTKKAIVMVIFFIVTDFGFLTGTPFTAIPLIMALPVITFCNISILQALRKPDPTGKINMHAHEETTPSYHL